jgi:digeranylgeranylglycerophospholipid reductase
MLYDVLIIGAGCAGLESAKLLGNAGIKVLLVDRKADILDLPFKTLGSFIDLDEFGLSRDVVATDINKATIYSKHFKCAGYGSAYILDKVKLHSELLEKINKQNVTLLLSTTIIDFSKDQDGLITSVTDDKNNKYEAKIIIDATGVSGLLSKKMGLQDEKPMVAVGVESNVAYSGDPHEAHFFIGKTFQGGYGWIFPLQNERAIIGFGSFENLVIKEMKQRFASIITNPLISKLITIDVDKAEGGIIPITEVKSKFVSGNLICIGDSVSQVNPVVGEGYRFIFQAAKLASDAIITAIKKDELSHLQRYEIAWNNEFYSKYKTAKKMQKLINTFSNSDLLVDLGILILKTKRRKTILKLFAGEFSKWDVYLP